MNYFIIYLNRLGYFANVSLKDVHIFGFFSFLLQLIRLLVVPRFHFLVGLCKVGGLLAKRRLGLFGKTPRFVEQV